MNDSIQNDTHAMAVEIEAALARQYGPMMADDVLSQALGYRTIDAFRQAFYRGRLPIPVFVLEKRHGKFALTRDVAHWLAQQRASARGASDVA